MNELIEYILKTNCYRTKDLADYARNNDLWDAFRRNYNVLRDYMSDNRIEVETKIKKKQKIEKERTLKNDY